MGYTKVTINIMIVNRWHKWVKQPKMSKKWHENDIADELAELDEARGIVNRWSEMSDVVYTVTRARWSGHNLSYPISRRQIIAGYFYMYPKYSLRVLFFRRAGRRAGYARELQSVRNPRKTHKLEQIARDNSLNEDVFVEVCKKQLRHWVLLP